MRGWGRETHTTWGKAEYSITMVGHFKLIMFFTNHIQYTIQRYSTKFAHYMNFNIISSVLVWCSTLSLLSWPLSVRIQTALYNASGTLCCTLRYMLSSDPLSLCRVYVKECLQLNMKWLAYVLTVNDMLCARGYRPGFFTVWRRFTLCCSMNVCMCGCRTNL